MNIKKIIFLFLIIFRFDTYLHSQTRNISGYVTDIYGTPVANVVISDQSGNIKDTTTSEGSFTINLIVGTKATLIFSCDGYSDYPLFLLPDTVSDKIWIKLEPIEYSSDEIIVTASKYKQRLSEIPVSAIILNSSVIQSKNHISLDNALRYVPGVSINLDQISIRGSSGYSRGAGTRVLVAYDGIPIYSGDSGEIIWEMLPITEVDKIEVIKGASSSLYGSSAIGGVVNIISKEPSGTPFNYFSSYYGVYGKPSYQTWDWSGELRPFNGQVFTHSNSLPDFGYTISFRRNENSGYRLNDYYKRLSGYVRVLTKLTKDIRINFFANHLYQDRGNFIYWKDSRNVLVPRDGDIGQTVKSNRFLTGLHFIYNLNERVDINIRSGYYDSHWQDRTESGNDSRSKILRNELQYSYSVPQFVTLTSGIEYLRSNVTSNIFGNPNMNGIGVYSQLEYTGLENYHISLGGRYDYSRISGISSSQAFSPKLGVNAKIIPNLTVRGSAGTSFRSPTLAEIFTSTTTSGIVIKPNPNLKPENNFSTEIGLHYVTTQGLEFDAAYFYNSYEDLIDPGIDPNDGKVTFRNITDAHIAGIDLMVSIPNIYNVFSFNAGYTLLDATDDSTGKFLKYRPRHLLYSSIDFSLAGIDLSLSSRYWSKVEEMDFELVELGIVKDGDKRTEVFVVDLSANYRFMTGALPIIIGLNIKNIFNFNYVEIIGNLAPIRNISLSFDTFF